MKKKLAFYILTLLILCEYVALGQIKQVQAFQEIINKGIKKAYPASVRMWSYDLQLKQRTGNQFSGVVVSADGYILTAAHTIFPGKNYKVFFPDGKECIATALGRIDNKETPGIPDVGMMKIVDPGSWPFAEMGYSSSLVPGEPCISISYPETLNQTLPTVRLGEIGETKNTYGFIRSTCKMEPGDSGGPLLDYLGRVVGLHSAVDVREDQNFEVPVDLYRKYRTALLKENNYTTFPHEQDSVHSDPLKSRIRVEVESGRLKPQLKSRITSPNSGYFIESTLKGMPTKISGTLLNIKGQDGKKRHFFISKNTMVGLDPLVIVEGKKLRLKVLLRDQGNDLVLLRVDQQIRGGIDFSPTDTDQEKLKVGSFLYTKKTGRDQVSSVLSSDTLALPKITSHAYLGAMVAYNTSPAQFSLIKPGSPAEKAGMKVGDELVSINGRKIAGSTEFAPLMTTFWPGDELGFEWISGEKKIAAAVTLEERIQPVFNHPAEKFQGGKSLRRDGFNGVFAHDAAIEPVDCGTPVFDLSGEFFGINIARFSRTATLILPASRIRKTIAKVLETQQ